MRLLNESEVFLFVFPVWPLLNRVLILFVLAFLLTEG